MPELDLSELLRKHHMGRSTNRIRARITETRKARWAYAKFRFWLAYAVAAEGAKETFRLFVTSNAGLVVEVGLWLFVAYVAVCFLLRRFL